MFTLTIDGAPGFFSAQGEKSFGEIMERLSASMSKQGKVITSIIMNNLQLTEGRQYDYREFPAGQIDSIELKTAEPVRLALEALDSSREHVDMLKQLCGQAAELFRRGDDFEANEQYSRLVEGLRWMVKGLSAMAGMLGMDENQPLASGKSLRYYQDEVLTPVFDGMYSSQQRDDYVELADRLEYELIPAMGQVEQLLEAFKRQLAAA